MLLLGYREWIVLLLNLEIFVVLRGFSRESDLLQVIDLISAFFVQVKFACAENFIHWLLLWLVFSRLFLIRRVFEIVDVIFFILV